MQHYRRGVFTGWLERSSPIVFTLYTITAAFTTYFCMYAFRKPYLAATYEGLSWGPFDELKTVFFLSQLIGYGLSKYIGIKICSETSRNQRIYWLISLIVVSELALIMFAVVPVPYKMLFIFFNGLPLGMVWGMVVSYLEGRRTSELLLAGLSCSFIVSSGMVKDFGVYLLESGITEFWMPAITGLCFLPLFLFAVWLLDQIPQPDVDDVEQRVEREPMDSKHRTRFIMEFLPGLIMLFIVYFFLTAYRDYRDTFHVDILVQLNVDEAMTMTELPISIGVLLALAALNLIKNNHWGLLGAYVIMGGGTAIMGIGTLLFDWGMISPIFWMFLVGLGSYLAYVPYGSVLFDRTIAATRVVGTAVFAIYVADALGYTGSMFLQIFKDVLFSDMPHGTFLKLYTYFISFVGTLLVSMSCIYFLGYRKSEKPIQPAEAAA